MFAETPFSVSLSLKEIYDIIKDLLGGKKENKKKIDDLWATTQNTIIIHQKLKYTLGGLLLNPKNKIIIISGVGGYGKTTVIHTIFDKFENENTKIIYDRRNQNDWIRIKNEDFYYNDSEFVVIDNFRELKQEELNDIEASIKNKRIVLICRESHISTLNEYTTHLNVNDFGFKWVENDVEEKILKVLPSFLKVPLYYNLLSNFKYHTEDIIKYINDYPKNEHQHEFIIGLLDIVFSELSDESKNLLTIFAMVVSDTIYDTPHLEYLLREIDLNTYKSTNKNILIELNKVLEKYPVFTNENIKSKYFHSVFSDYFIEKLMLNNQKSEFYNGMYFQSVIANINWKLEAGISQPFHKKVDYISYARNIINYCFNNIGEIIDFAKDIRLVKIFLNFLNSYSYIYIKTFNQVDEIEFLQQLQNVIISSLEKDNIQKKWKEHFGKDHYYYSKAQFYTVSSKVALCLAVNGNSFSINNYIKAFDLCENSKVVIEKINDNIKRNIRQGVYCYTKAMILYKGALFFDRFDCFNCDNKQINSKKDILELSYEYIITSEKNGILGIKNSYNEYFNCNSYDFYSYNISEYNKIIDEIKISEEMGSYLSTLELKCIIKSQLVRINSTKKRELMELFRFTSNGFFNVNGYASQNDKMRFREVLLMQLLFEKNEGAKDKLTELLQSTITRVENFEDRRFMFLKALAFKYADINANITRKDLNLGDWMYLNQQGAINKIDLWKTFFKLLIT